MNNQYTLEELIKIFGEHSEEYIKSCKEHPEINMGDFNLPLAFQTICKEIEQCKAPLH